MRDLPAGEIELEDGGAALLDVHALLADVAARADRHVKLGAVGAGQQCARPMVADRQVEELRALVGDAGLRRPCRGSAPRCRCWRHRAGRRPAPCRRAGAGLRGRRTVSSATPSPLASRSSEMRLAFSAIEPERRCTQVCAIARGDQELPGSLAASATSTSPLGSTCSQRGCLRFLAKACTARPVGCLRRHALRPRLAGHRPFHGRAASFPWDREFGASARVLVAPLRGSSSRSSLVPVRTSDRTPGFCASLILRNVAVQNTASAISLNGAGPHRQSPERESACMNAIATGEVPIEPVGRGTTDKKSPAEAGLGLMSNAVIIGVHWDCAACRASASARRSGPLAC